MPDLGKAYVQILPSAEGISGRIRNLLEGPSEEAGESAGGKAGSALAGAIGKAAVAAGIGKILKDSFEAGGALEQSFGGLDTIYGAAADEAKAFAVQAASAGISANSYAEQAVSFGAALKQAFGGDTTAAMEAANTAIMDMADNSAKMGTDIGSIQTAYQGFAKQNYTMLDNLKLGYGGTKEEMERLLARAQELSGVEYNIDNLGDVYSAIHVIQDELGLTGVAADEAKTTLTGSFGAMKASWENLMAALTTGNGMGSAMQSLGESAKNVLDNVLRMAGNLVVQLPTVLSSLADGVRTLMSGAGDSAVTGLLDAILQSAPSLLTAGVDLLMTVAQGIMQALPQILVMGLQVVYDLAAGILTALPQIAVSAVDIVMTLINSLLQHLPDIIEAGLELLLPLAEGIIMAVPTIIVALVELIDQLIQTFKETDWASLGHQLIDGVVEGVKNAAIRLWKAVRDAVRGALSAAQEEAEVGSPSRLFARELGQWIPAGAAVGVEDNTEPFIHSVQDMVDLAATDYERYTKPASFAQPTERQDDRGGGMQAIEIRFSGSLAQLARVLQPEIAAVENWHGEKLIRA